MKNIGRESEGQKYLVEHCETGAVELNLENTAECSLDIGTNANK